MRPFPLICIASMICAAPALAQSTTAAKSDPEAPWVYGCEPAAEDTAGLCRIVQNLTLKRGEAQQRLLTVIIREQPEAKPLALLLALPHGLFHPAGVQLKVDDNEPSRLVIQTSDAKGAYAGTEMTEALAAAMKKGAKMTVTFQSAQRKNVSVPVTLRGFTAAYNKLKTAK